ncbi:MAG: alpha-L-arabinofuranosidase [Bacteroidales bacterium]|nr:alpha-L-arabinofuranosidase [Bacteroidales bacterium]
MNTKGKVSAVLAFILIACQAVFAAEPVVTVRMSKAVTGDKMLYGWHYEEIGMIGDGGLYAEMVRNRGFEEANLPEGLVIENGMYKDMPNPRQPIKQVYQIDPLVGWLTTPLGKSPVRISRVSREPLNSTNPHSMEVRVLEDIPTGSIAAVHNSGYFGMAFKKGVPCRLSFYMRTDSYDGKVAFRLSDGSGAPCSKEVWFTPVKGEWKKYEAELLPDRDLPDGMLSIVPTVKGRFQLDMVSMFPSDTYDDGKSVFRADVLQNLVNYHPDFLRFPGGCIVHGVNEETMYHWKKTIGDIAARPGEWSKWEPHYRTDGLGYHEFYELCEYLGCAAMYVTPTGMACTEWVKRGPDGRYIHKETDAEYYIQDLLDAIEYAIGPVDSKWGSERAKNGHPAPFPLKFIEIGNEDFGPVYYERYHEIYVAVKAKYPQLSFIADCPIGSEAEIEATLERFGDGGKIEIYDEHYYKGIPWALGQFHKYDSYRRDISIFVGELGIQSNGVGGPSGAYPGSLLAECVFKMGLERNVDLHPIMADRPLMRNWECIERNDMQPLVLNNSIVSAKTFNYYMCKMLRDNAFDTSFKVDNTEGEKEIFVTSGMDSQRKQLIIKIVNMSETQKRLVLKTDRHLRGRKATITTLSATSDQRVTPLTPDAVSPVTKETTFSSGKPVELPGNSFVVYRIDI